ncbi:2-dehydropantoate 2-reductase N-terminal domain-containing protein [Streptomyces mirabilis]
MATPRAGLADEDPGGGAGAKGGCFGARLARVGRDVTFLVRAERAPLRPENDASSPLTSEVHPTCARRDLDRAEDAERV